MRSGLFPATQWTVVLDAREAPTPVAMEALERLAREYWQPLYIFLRQRGSKETEAADFVQGFFEHLLGREFFKNVRAREGRFRTFLLSAFTNWLSDERARAQAQKRGGGVWHIPIQEMESGYMMGLVTTDAPPEEAFDRGWARSLFNHAISRLEDESAASGRGALFTALRGTLSGELGEETQAAIGARLGMSEGAVKKAAFDLRARFAAELRAQVRTTVRDDAAVDDELRYLIRLLRS